MLPHSSPPGEPGICVPEQACILRKLQYVLLPVPFWSRHGHNFPRFPLPSHRHEKQQDWKYIALYNPCLHCFLCREIQADRHGMISVINFRIQLFTKIRIASSCFRSASFLEESTSIFPYDSVCRIVFIVFDINISYFLSDYISIYLLSGNARCVTISRHKNPLSYSTQPGGSFHILLILNDVHPHCCTFHRILQQMQVVHHVHINGKCLQMH